MDDAITICLRLGSRVYDYLARYIQISFSSPFLFLFSFKKKLKKKEMVLAIAILEQHVYQDYI